MNLQLPGVARCRAASGEVGVEFDCWVYAINQLTQPTSYGSIRAALEKQGQPIGINNLHIAALARSNGLTLVTNNLREFERVPGLLLENWVDD